MNTTDVIIVRYGEVALKGMNKPYFERILMERIRKAIKTVADNRDIYVDKDGGLVVIRGDINEVKDELIKKTLKVFGVASCSPAKSLKRLTHANEREHPAAAEDELNAIGEVAVAYIKELIESGKVIRKLAQAGQAPNNPQLANYTFKVDAKRADKTFGITSPAMSKEIGGIVLKALGDELSVNVHNPDILLTVHLKQAETFFYDEKSMGMGGLPLGTNGKGMVLLSGGIDSPVATWMMAKRGMRIEAVHYTSYPFTSQRAQEKVEELASIVASYCGNFKMHVVNLLPAQEAIAKHCPEDEMTLLVRRFMMTVAERLAIGMRCDVLITGENLGQVASQTAASLVATDAAVTIPVMRPLIGLDKVDIMDIAREIGTYDKSIEPHEDCCTVFLPKHPKTRPTKEGIEKSLALIPDFEELLDKMIESREVVHIEAQ
ncbi:MAG: tRNA 4-thiouridine(8) synthase ThiI [Clostridiales Family XIII bacterium]|nr:tRNA 4-thiouridine(8) synthase ThiI [Clostridiales Family XIII bacterium]